MLTKAMMTRREFLAGLSFAGASALAGGGAVGCSSPAGDPVEDPSKAVSLEPTRENGYLGRWFRKDVDGTGCMVTTAPGAFLELAVQGTRSLLVHLDSLIDARPFYWTYQIDGNKTHRQQTGRHEVPLPDTGKHVVRITADGMLISKKRWDNERGFALRGIDPCSGSCAPHPLEGRVIAYYGDSITEGDCVYGPNSLPVSCSASHGYATLSAAELGCLPACSGYGGTGITTRGTFAPALEAVTHYSKTRPAPRFDADLVVVEYGTNDWGATHGAFTRGYAELLEKLAQIHPGTTICCMVPLPQTHAGAIRSCASAAGAQVVETAGWDVDLVADGTHPSVDGARTMASKLAEALRPFLA